jgi:hypothetical protein
MVAEASNGKECVSVEKVTKGLRGSHRQEESQLQADPSSEGCRATT